MQDDATIPPAPERLDPAWLATITPVVLVGGSSKRFGNDKLRRRLDEDTILVERPVRALREVFGPRVAAVGACHPKVRACFDADILDPYPGLGPMGGILAALEHAPGPIFVLAGDLDAIDAACVRKIAAAAQVSELAEAVIASSGRDHPTIGLYRPVLCEPMRLAAAGGGLTMHAFLRAHTIERVEIDERLAHNVNRPADLPIR